MTNQVTYAFMEGQEVKLRVDPDQTVLLVVALHTQNKGNSYTVSNGLYTGVHCEYELVTLDAQPKKTGRKAGFAGKSEDTKE